MAEKPNLLPHRPKGLVVTVDNPKYVHTTNNNPACSMSMNADYMNSLTAESVHSIPRSHLNFADSSKESNQDKLSKPRVNATERAEKLRRQAEERRSGNKSKNTENDEDEEEEAYPKCMCLKKAIETLNFLKTMKLLDIGLQEAVQL